MVERTILVTGATGTQGGAVADALLRRDAEIHALTRDPSQPAAERLERAGARTVEGDLADPASLEAALEPVDAVFAVTNFWEHGYEDEIEQGTNLVEAAADAGIEHLVFSSVGGAERDTGIPHFDSKFEIEQRIEDRGIPATVVRPVFFMQNFETMEDPILDGTLPMALEPGVSLQMLDIPDLGEFVAEAFADPDRYIGEAFELASDELTLQATASRFGDVMGTPARAHHLTIDELEAQMGEEYAVMFTWFNEHGYEADLTGLRADHEVDFGRLETYLEREGWGKRT